MYFFQVYFLLKQYKEKVYTLGLERKDEEDVWSFSWVKEAAK